MTSVASHGNNIRTEDNENDNSRSSSNSYSPPDVSFMEIYASHCGDLPVTPTRETFLQKNSNAASRPPAGMNDDVDDMLSLDSDVSTSLIYSLALKSISGE